MEVSIIIVNYNTKQLLKDSLISIYEHTQDVKFEIIIVDNASVDGSQEMVKSYFPNVILIESDQNLGFGKANNLGAKYANGEFLFFLNSDCLLIENTIKIMHNYFEINKNSNIGAIGCILLDKEKKINTSYQRFPTPHFLVKDLLFKRIQSITGIVLKQKERVNYNLTDSCNVDFITGADLFIPKMIFNSFNGFDSTFFMYYEETDLQKRMAEKSLKRVVLNDTNIIHLEGGSKQTKLATIFMFIDSQYKYIKKHYSTIIYMLFYLFITPLILPSIFVRSASKTDRIKFIKMLLKHLYPNE